MPDSLPDWFAADQVHDAGDGWYIGTPDGFRVGPFLTRDLAEIQSRELTARLKRCRSTTERVRLIRRFIINQSLRHGRRVRGAAHPEQAAARPPGDTPPPVRAGERPRLWFRTHRVFAVGGVWFFATREGLDIGPYASREEARQDAERLQNILRATTGPDASRRAVLEFVAQSAAGAPD